jgi:dipeptidyl aminopeptidase/acylaminoacyl peptidase
MSAVREPDLYKCVVGYAGVYDLEKWKRDSDVGDSVKGRTYIADFVGATPDRLQNASPLRYINSLKAAIMIVHGEEDERVPFNQAKALRSALDERHYPYEWLAKSGEGHGFYKEENRIELYEKLLAFLDKNIGKSIDSAAPLNPQSAAQ